MKSPLRLFRLNDGSEVVLNTPDSGAKIMRRIFRAVDRIRSALEKAAVEAPCVLEALEAFEDLMEGFFGAMDSGTAVVRAPRPTAELCQRLAPQIWMAYDSNHQPVALDAAVWDALAYEHNILVICKQ